MSQDERYLTRSDPTLVRVSEASLRLLAGLVPKKTLLELQEVVRTASGAYPWEQVVDAILAFPCHQEELVQQGLRAQRDWVVRGGRETPGKSLSAHTKTFLAQMLVRILMFGLYLGVVATALVILKMRWPSVDIYSVIPWLREHAPMLFPPK